jgi:menaquinone-dependent protoporphyrinogen oxidase
MRTLIAYSTKSGASRECAESLASEIEGCKICDLKETTPDITEFDIVILGSGIRFGGAYKPFKKFLKENADALLKKKIAFFVSNVVTENFQKIIEKNIPEELRSAAFCIRTFGGRAPIGKAKNDPNWMLKDEVDAFVRAVKEIV